MPALSALRLRQFRRFASLNFVPGPAVNLLLGANGSGKTSVLEALYYVCRGRSFRAAKAVEIIRQGEASALAEASWRAPHGAFTVRGVLKANGERRLSLQGKRVRNRTELLTRLPLVFLATHNLDIIGCPPARRRAFLNGLLLHVVPEVASLLRDYDRCLSERNRRLAQHPKHYTLMEPWDRTLAALGERLEEHRGRFVDILIQGVAELLAAWGGLEIDITYARGWPAGVSLTQILATVFPQDLRHGFSTQGCHRADLHLRCHAHKAAHRLSSGQSNMVSLAFFCAAHRLLVAALRTEIPLVLDDVIQRFDRANLLCISDFIRRHATQTLITATDYPMHWPGLDTDRRWQVVDNALQAA